MEATSNEVHRSEPCIRDFSFSFQAMAPFPDFTGGIFEGDGALVELPRLESPEARRGNLYWITPNSFTDTPFTDLSQLMKKINEERGSIGLSPHVPAEQR